MNDPIRGLSVEPVVEAIGVWGWLLGGAWSVVRNVECDDRRVILARHGAPDDLRRLSPREGAIALAAARGHTNKAIARALGLAVSTVASHLSSACDKLGFVRRAQLIAMHGHLAGGTPAHASIELDRWRVGDEEVAALAVHLDPPSWPADLRTVEREICRLLVRGRSIAEIAHARGTSTHTVTNQLYAMYRRYRVRGRTGLIIAVLDRAYRSPIGS